MRVTRTEIWSADLTLREPYAVAYGRFAVVKNVFVRLHTDGPLVGHGCASPEAAVTGETPESTVTALSDAAGDFLDGVDPLERERALEPLRRRLLPRQPAALAAVEMALLDLLGQAAGMPLYALLGGFRRGMPTSVTVGICDERQTVQRARDRVALGFRCLKLKGGQDVDSDITRTLKVREAIGPDIELRFDANGGYDLQDGLRFLQGTRTAKLAVLEQPTPAKRPELMGQLITQTTVPVMADESLLDIGDAVRLASARQASMLNVKLMKVGGIFVAQQITAIAAAAGMALMIGCMDESAIGIAAALHLVLASPHITMADLDGHLGIVDDPYAETVSLREGVLYPSQHAGLGVGRGHPVTRNGAPA